MERVPFMTQERTKASTAQPALGPAPFALGGVLARVSLLEAHAPSGKTGVSGFRALSVIGALL